MKCRFVGIVEFPVGENSAMLDPPLCKFSTAMDKSLSKAGDASPQRFLDRAEVLQATVEQLRKDLALDAEELPTPPDPENAFEQLRAGVFPVLQQLSNVGEQRLKVAMYRVDIPEPHLRRTMASGGLHALAGEVVLRALQKVLTRLRFAGRF